METDKREIPIIPFRLRIIDDIVSNVAVLPKYFHMETRKNRAFYARSKCIVYCINNKSW